VWCVPWLLLEQALLFFRQQFSPGEEQSSAGMMLAGHSSS
jgi:hypothetical protein